MGAPSELLPDGLKGMDHPDGLKGMDHPPPPPLTHLTFADDVVLIAKSPRLPGIRRQGGRRRQEQECLMMGPAGMGQEWGVTRVWGVAG